jgi:acetoin utilization deacetylase AcuC-like enzyme
MILYRPGRRAPLGEFGIDIPSSPDKIGRVLNALKSHEVLGPLVDRWLIGADDSVVTREDLLRTHSPEYVGKLFSDQVEEVLIKVFELVDKDGNYNRYDPAKAKRPLSGMFDRSLRGLAGTYQACEVALETGFCFYLAGGGHHAHRDFGHGFCVINDILVALHKMQFEGRIKTAWIIDVDVHKGDGVAAITEGDDSIITLSSHMAHGWPLDLPEFREDGSRHPSYTPSDIDIPIDKSEGREYNPRLLDGLAKLEAFPRPDLALVQLGADPYEKDGLPSTDLLNLTLEQMNERNLIIYDFLKKRSIPGIYLMSGGYGEYSWEPYPDFLIHALRDHLGV